MILFLSKNGRYPFVNRLPVPVCTCAVVSTSGSSDSSVDSAPPVQRVLSTPWLRFRSVFGRFSGMLPLSQSESGRPISEMYKWILLALRYVPSTIAFVGGVYALHRVINKLHFYITCFTSIL